MRRCRPRTCPHHRLLPPWLRSSRRCRRLPPTPSPPALDRVCPMGASAASLRPASSKSTNVTIAIMTTSCMSGSMRRRRRRVCQRSRRVRPQGQSLPLVQRPLLLLQSLPPLQHLHLHLRLRQGLRSQPRRLDPPSLRRRQHRQSQHPWRRQRPHRVRPQQSPRHRQRQQSLRLLLRRCRGRTRKCLRARAAV